MESITSPPTPASGVMQVGQNHHLANTFSHISIFVLFIEGQRVRANFGLFLKSRLDVNLDTELGQNPWIVGKHLRKILISIEDRSLFA
jgi:hypothetical protein